MHRAGKISTVVMLLPAILAAGVMPQRVLAAGRSPDREQGMAHARPAKCCCGGLSPQCCGSLCCSKPDSRQQPATPPTRNSQDERASQPSLVAAVGVEFPDNSRSAGIGQAPSNSWAILFAPTLQAQHVRIQV